MGKETGISWTDHTFNPWWGCAKVSAGCTHCYAETFSKRVGLKVWGEAGERRVFGEKHWREPLKWNQAAAAAGVRKRVFCASMADVFEDHPIATQERPRLWSLIEATPWLDWQLLTKRPENILGIIPWGKLNAPANVWLGCTAENQEMADKRIPLLLQAPAAVRFVSAEPLLGPLRVDDLGDGHGGAIKPLVGLHWVPTSRGMVVKDGRKGPLLDWVIVGGESGPRARPCALEWIHGVVDQCRAAGTAVLVKQLGAFVVSELRACDTDEEAKAQFGFDSRWLWRAGLEKDNQKGQDVGRLAPELDIRMFPGDAWPPPAPPAEEPECAF